MPGRRPDAALHQRRHEPVQGRCSSAREKRAYTPRHDLAEVHARQRQAQRPRQRRAVAAASHVLRDARQLLVRRLLQARGDPVRLGAADRRSGSCRPDRLFPTIFKGEAGIPRDDEAYAIWTKFVPAARITELGLAENFWQMGETGPCGRCSEIHYYRGAAHALRGGAARRHVPRARLQLRSLRRDLEQRVHGVRPAGRRHAEAAAGAVDRHRAWASSASPR